MKILKILALLAAAFTAGEVVNEYRSQTEPTSFISFLKKFMRNNQIETEKLLAGIAAADTIQGTREPLMKALFPNRK